MRLCHHPIESTHQLHAHGLIWSKIAVKIKWTKWTPSNWKQPVNRKWGMIPQTRFLHPWSYTSFAKMCAAVHLFSFEQISKITVSRIQSVGSRQNMGRKPSKRDSRRSQTDHKRFYFPFSPLENSRNKPQSWQKYPKLSVNREKIALMRWQRYLWKIAHLLRGLPQNLRAADLALQHLDPSPDRSLCSSPGPCRV